ncbi:MAG: ligase-associated DNA damage response endonuclease PdeM [Neomegalonema sp.]|nr:ligase-associated DNA damage response endonuclease PdeM [Neomegalonema sp.]
MQIGGLEIELRASGGAFLPASRTLIVADLHLGKSERTARRGGALLPPFDNAETIARLTSEIAATRPDRLICLGDSFDDSNAARALPQPTKTRLAALAAGRDWIWITGNHDPAPELDVGAVATEIIEAGIVFRHIASPLMTGAGEVSGHYHPKATLTLRGRRIARRCFLASDRRLILPAFGAYTGGLEISDAAFDPLFTEGATAFLLSSDSTIATPR